MSTVDNLTDAYNDAIRVFTTAGIDTDIVDDAYNTANSWGNSASAIWDATEDTVNPADVAAGYEAAKASTFWETLGINYSNTYGVSDKISDYIDSASHAANLEASNAYGERVGATQVGEALAETGKDIKNAGKIGIPAILVAGALFLWATS